MKAIILPVGITESLKLLTDHIPENQLPVANKPVVEHLIELLVRNRITDIIFVKKHLPYQTEQYFGGGERWGATITYALISEYKSITHTLLRVDASKMDDSFVFLPANCVTNLDLAAFADFHFHNGADITFSLPATKETMTSDKAARLRPWHPFILTPQALACVITHKTTDDLPSIVSLLGSQNLASSIFSSDYDFLSIDSLADYWEANKRILNGDFKGILIPGRQSSSGVWTNIGAGIHPDAKITAPVLAGAGCNILEGAQAGPNVILGDHVIVDHHAILSDSIVLDHTYIGSHTQVKDSVAGKDYLINIPGNFSTFIGDDRIIGDLAKPMVASKGERMLNLILALMLTLVLAPLFIILFLFHLLFPSKNYFSLKKRYSRYETVDMMGGKKPKAFDLYSFDSRYRFIGKIAGLFNVIKGDLNLVGVTPLTEAQLESIEHEWQTLRFHAPSGLFHIWEVEGSPDMSWEEKLAADSYYAAMRSIKMDMKILFKRLFRW
ncbi:sugar transferase [Desulfococcaceae bacterium HSG9]|nr:sugar transferase [Desulfococcaceae bacterium HSG9]